MENSNYITYSYDVTNNNSGLYKFELRFKNGKKFEFDNYIIIADNFSSLFNFNQPKYISSNYRPVISFNDKFDISFIPNVTFILSINETEEYEFLYEDNEYFLPEEAKEKINYSGEDEFSIKINHSNYTIFNKTVLFFQSPFLEDSYYKNNITFINDSYIFKPIYITKMGSVEEYTLTCNNENEKIICETKYPFIDTMKDNFYIYYNYSNYMNYEKKTINNNIESSNIIVLKVTNDNKTYIIIHTKNYNVSNINSINISDISFDKNTFKKEENSLIFNTTIEGIQTIKEIIVNETGQIRSKINFDENEKEVITFDLNIIVDDKIILMSNNEEVEIKIKVSGDGMKYISSIYYKLDIEREFKNKFEEINDEEFNYRGKVNKNGTYVFGYSLLNLSQIFLYDQNTNKTIFDKKTLLRYDTQCILINNSFQIHFTSQIIVKLIESERIHLIGKLNNLQCKLENNYTTYKCEPLSVGDYKFELFQDDNLLYELPIKHSNLINQQIYYKDYIYFDDTYCIFDKLGIKLNKKDTSIIPLFCNKDDDIDLANRIICKIETDIIFGEYMLYFGNNNSLLNLSIYNTLNESIFNIIEPKGNEIFPGSLAITIENTNRDFYMEFLDKIIIMSDKGNEESRNIVSNKNKFSFKITGIEGYTYTFYLFCKDIDNYHSNSYITLDRQIYIQHSKFNISSSSISLIDKSIKSTQIVNFQLTFEANELNNSNNIYQIYINKVQNINQNLRCKKYNNLIVNCEYPQKISEAAILTIKYKYWERYFYIFAYESTGSICPKVQ